MRFTNGTWQSWERRSTSAPATGRVRVRPIGIRHGARTIRNWHPDLEIHPFGTQQVVDAGDIPCSTYVIDDAIKTIEAAADELSQESKRLVTLGGDHTIAFPLLRSAHRRHGPVALVHFDAHVDTYDTYMNAAYTHGTPFRRAAEEGLFVPGHSMHIGIRGSKYRLEDLGEDAGFGFTVLGTWEIEQIGIDGYVTRIREQVGDRLCTCPWTSTSSTRRSLLRQAHPRSVASRPGS